MKLNNFSKYISDEQIYGILKLFQNNLNKTNLVINVLSKEDDYLKLKLRRSIKKKLEHFLNNETESHGVFYYPENQIFIVENRFYNENDEFYILFTYLLSHEIRHFIQSYVLKDRWHTVQKDYFVPSIDEKDKLHWCEKDAYWFCGDFVNKNIYEIARLMQLDNIFRIPEHPATCEIDPITIWQEYRKNISWLIRLNFVIDDIWFMKKRKQLMYK
ncbi:hypothetical protein NSQ59_27155 [Margalitia sp. FSL K6-0131]|uniref:hypothetical protein n=1 Tax=Margalitia sp. FSL K6-0131 TaxID=2954604 RepID=UPI0030FC9BD6